MSDFDPNNPEHIERLRNAPEFLDGMSKLKGPFEKLQREGLRPIVDEDGEFQISGEQDEGVTQDFMNRMRHNASIIGRLLPMKEDPLRHQMLIEATKLFQRGEL